MSTDINELKPCPFCGGEASNAMNCGDDFNEFPFSVECNECAASTDCFSDDGSAVAAWNTRAALSDLEQARSEIEGMRKALEPFAKAADAMVAGVPEDTALGLFAGGNMMFGPDFPNVGDLNKARAALSSSPPAQHADGWQPMSTAPTNGRHCILAVKSGAFIWSVQGCYDDTLNVWNTVLGDDSEPLAWMPNVPLPDKFKPWDVPAPPASSLREGEGA